MIRKEFEAFASKQSGVSKPKSYLPPLPESHVASRIKLDGGEDNAALQQNEKICENPTTKENLHGEAKALVTEKLQETTSKILHEDKDDPNKNIYLFPPLSMNACLNPRDIKKYSGQNIFSCDALPAEEHEQTTAQEWTMDDALDLSKRHLIKSWGDNTNNDLEQIEELLRKIGLYRTKVKVESTDDLVEEKNDGHDALPQSQCKKENENTGDNVELKDAELEELPQIGVVKEETNSPNSNVA